KEKKKKANKSPLVKSASARPGQPGKLAGGFRFGRLLRNNRSRRGPPARPAPTAFSPNA
ncbi:hypothetical protein EVAR_93588_1, partial [Eumeta japonica]